MEKKFKIKVIPYFYGGTCNAPVMHFLHYSELPENHPKYAACEEVVEFETLEDAEQVKEWLDEQNEGYVCQHGEYSAPSFEVVDADERLVEEDCIPHDYEMDEDDWELIEIDSLPEKVQEQLKYRVDVQEYKNSDGDHEVWAGETKIDGVEYAVTYMVSTARVWAVEDLGDIDWNNANYYRRIETEN